MQMYTQHDTNLMTQSLCKP